MLDFMNIGATPAEEECAQVGTPGYYERALKECRVFINQIRRVVGPEPDGARLGTKVFDHDFGSYREVVCYYDDNNEEAVNYAFQCEGSGPLTWDEQAKEELNA